MPPKTITTNTLFYGDNLFVLRNYIPDESVDLIYLDPPFNSSRTYNVLFKDESGTDSEAQITAFEDTWHWGPTAEATYRELITGAPERVSTAVDALLTLIGRNQMMAYLAMMAVRLVELHRVLKPTGSLYLHCDPTASHYLKVILDAVFGAEHFIGEIVWKRTTTHSDARRKFPSVSDSILLYSKTDEYVFNPQYQPHDLEYVESFYRFDDNDGRGPYRLDNMASPNPRPNMMYEWMGYPCPAKGWRYERETMQRLHDEGRIYYPKKPDGTPATSKRLALKRYLSEQKGNIVANIWADIPPISAQARERTGYPTQKPRALLERIIATSTNPADWVLDPFCGCGTTVIAAQKLERRWIGIDITHLSIALQKYLLADLFPDVGFDVIGEPQDLAGARQLAAENRYQFQWWALSLVHAKPVGGEAGSRKGKKGRDRGIDGAIYFMDDNGGQPRRVVVQVKSGHVRSGDIRDLVGVLEREKAVIGVFITLEAPTRDMLTEAASAGVYSSRGWGRDYPRVQILTIADLLEGKKIDMPPPHGTFKQPPRIDQPNASQSALDL